MDTDTVAPSSLPAVALSASVIVTGTVVVCCAPVPLVVATVPTSVIVPLTLVPLGSATVTPAPAWTSVCWRASRLTLTTWLGEVPSMISWPVEEAAPALTLTCETRSGPGRKTASPGFTTPVCDTPSAACQRLTAAASAPVKPPSAVSPAP